MSRWIPPTLDFPPVALSPRTQDRDAIAAAEGRDLVQERVTRIARVAVFVLFLGIAVRLLCGCTPSQQLAVETAAEVGREVACALCQKPLPPPPVVPQNPTPDQILGLAAWAASVEERMRDVQRTVAEELAKRAAAVPAPSATPSAAPAPP